MNIRLTKKRQAILDVLKNTHDTMSAADIHTQLPDMDLVTIYRNLELFTKEKLIKKVALESAEAQYEFQDEPHHHAQCIDCKKVIHFKASDEAIEKLLKIKDFSIEDVELTVKGKCCK